MRSPDRWRRLVALLTLLTASCAVGLAAPPARRPKAPAPAPAVDENTPEGAFKAFMMAMATGDEPKLRAITLPAEGFEWLLKGQHLTTDQVDRFQEVVEKLPVRPLKPGDEFTLPGGRLMKVRPEEVTPVRAVVLQEGAPVPTRCQKVEGRWRVDPSPIIAARRAAEAARRRGAGKAGSAPDRPAHAPRS